MMNKELETDPNEGALPVETLVEPAEIDVDIDNIIYAADALVSESDITAAVPKYQMLTPPGGQPDHFYDLAHSRKLTDQLMLIIEAEGPVHESVLHRRIARAWGLERTGPRIVDRLRMLTPHQVGKTSEGEVTFYWPVGVNPLVWAGFREASEDETSRRRVDDVCLQELGNGVLHVLNQVGSAPQVDVAKSVCRLIGMSRTPADAEARVGLAIANLSSKGHIEVKSGLLRLP